MFGIGTPPIPALPNCFSTGSLTRLPATMFAGYRRLACSRSSWKLGFIISLATRSFARLATPCAAANFVTIIPCTPRNGTERNLIFGSWMILNGIPLALSPSVSHGPVIQNAAFCLSHAFLPVP